MGHKVFLSYKFKDTSVCQNIVHNLTESIPLRPLGKRTPRDYANVIETYIKEYSDHIYKGEEDGEPINGKTDDQIYELLKGRMFNSSLTIVLISPNMKTDEPEREQWIPWEVSYSIGTSTRKSSSGKPVRSTTNAMLAIVLPDKDNSYEYYFESKNCCANGCRVNKTSILFKILQKNTFNLKKTETWKCDQGDNIHSGNMHSFIPFYKWSDINSHKKMEKAIEHSFDILFQKEKYNICYDVD